MLLEIILLIFNKFALILFALILFTFKLELDINIVWKIELALFKVKYLDDNETPFSIKLEDEILELTVKLVFIVPPDINKNEFDAVVLDI